MWNQTLMNSSLLQLNLTIEGILRISPSPQPFLFSSFNGGLESALESGTPETSQIGFPERRDRSSLSTHNNPRTSRRSSALTSPSNPHHFPESQSQIVAFEQHVSKERKKRWLRMVSRVVITALCVGVAVVLPGFGRVMAFLGSFSAFLICIILPVRLHLLHHPFSLRNSKLISILKAPILHPPVPHSPSVLSPIAPFTHILTDCPLATHVKMDQRQIYEYDTLGIGNRQYGADDSRDCMGVPARKWA